MPRFKTADPKRLPKLHIKTVYAFAFDSSLSTPESKAVLEYVAAYKRDDKELTEFVARHTKLGHSVGIFTGKSEWH